MAWSPTVSALRSTLMMFNVIRMIFLFRFVLGQSYLKRIYSFLAQFLRLFGYAKQSKTFFRLLVSRPLGFTLSIRVMCAKFHFKKKTCFYFFFHSQTLSIRWAMM
jgi:hypothetical protein